MPNIKTYEAGDVALHPEERGITALSEAAASSSRYGNQAARDYSRAASFYNQGVEAIGGTLGDLYKQYKNNEDTLATTEAMQKEADFDLQQHRQLDGIMNPRQDPTDPTGQRQVQPKGNEISGLIGDRLQQWRDSREELRGQITNDKALKQFDRNTATSYRQYAAKAYATEGHVNYATAGNNLVQAAQLNAGVVYADPTQLDAQLTKLHDQIGDVSSSMNMTAENRVKFQTEFQQKSARALIESAVEGSARLGPGGRQHALDMVNSGKYDAWIGTDKEKLINHIHTMDRSDRADQEAVRKQQHEQEKDKAFSRTDQYVQDMGSGNPKMKLTDIIQDPAYANRPDLRKEAVGVFETMRKLQSQELSVSPVVSHDKMMDLVNRINQPFGTEGRVADRSEIDKVFGQDHSLTDKDYKFALSQLSNRDKPMQASLTRQREQFIKDNALTVDPTRIGGNPASALGNQRLNELRQDMIRQENALATAGKDPNTLYDPHAPEYMGRQLAKFAVSPKDAKQYNEVLVKDLAGTLKKYTPAGGDTAVMQHADIASQYKNFFSSGRADGAGINFDPRVDLQTIKVGDKAVQVNRYAAPHFQGFLNELRDRGYNINELGGYSERTKRGSITGSPSEHSFGNAIDVNQATNGFKGDRTDMPKDIAEIAAKHGLIWGGNWHKGSQDPMHFEWSGLPVSEATSYSMAGGQPTATAEIPRGATPWPKVQKMEDVGRLTPGTRFIIPEGKYKGMIGTVPAPEVPQSR